MEIYSIIGLVSGLFVPARPNQFKKGISNTPRKRPNPTKLLPRPFFSPLWEVFPFQLTRMGIIKRSSKKQNQILLKISLSPYPPRTVIHQCRKLLFLNFRNGKSMREKTGFNQNITLQATPQLVILLKAHLWVCFFFHLILATLTLAFHKSTIFFWPYHHN